MAWCATCLSLDEAVSWHRGVRRDWNGDDQ
jgi:hypothetical protein